MKKFTYVLLLGSLGATLNSAMHKRALDENRAKIQGEDKRHPAIVKYKQECEKEWRGEYAECCDMCDACCQVCDRPGFLPLTATLAAVFAFTCWQSKSTPCPSVHNH